MVVSLLLFAGPLLADKGAPVPVSPGGDYGLPEAESECPTFSWAAQSDAREIDLLVFSLESLWDSGPRAPLDSAPVVQMRLPRGTRSWTASGRHCLKTGQRYAWFVRLLGRNPLVSEPAHFVVGRRFSGPRDLDPSQEFKDSLSDLRALLGHSPTLSVLAPEDDSLGVGTAGDALVIDGESVVTEDLICTWTQGSSCNLGASIDSFCSVQATCPDGEKIVAGACEGNTTTAISDSRPLTDGWTCTFRRIGLVFSSSEHETWTCCR
jgi:hypothetical protein